jgi:hypothetical protein
VFVHGWQQQQQQQQQRQLRQHHAWHFTYARAVLHGCHIIMQLWSPVFVPPVPCMFAQCTPH